MNQQSEEEDNKVNAYISKNPIGEQTAEKLHRKMLKNLCQFFTPFKQYYQTYPVQYLASPKPTYIEQQPHQYKYKLSLNRQLEYFHGTVGKQHIDEQYMESLLTEQMKDRGLVENHQNKSLFVGDLFVYASRSRVESLRFVDDYSNSSNTNTNTITPASATNKNNIPLQIKLVSQQFSETIYQISHYQDMMIVVRCRYWIYLFDISTGKILCQTRLKQEITCFAPIYDSKTLLICTYDQKNYLLYSWNICSNEVTCLRVCQSFYAVHSLVGFNRRQFIMGQANQIFIEDLRCKGRETLKRISQIGNDRFCSVAQMSEPKNQIVVSRAKFLDIFDLRSANPSLYSIRHFCEESPPSCLLTLKWISSIVIAYSPYQNGSSLLFHVGQSANDKNNYTTQVQKIDPPMLLFDSGKFYKGLYPKSITPKVNQNILRLFHIDSSDGVSLEVIKKSEQFNISHLNSSRIRGYPQQPCKRWVLQKQLAPYLDVKNISSSSDQDSQSDQSEQQIEESPVFLKKNNYCSLDKFHHKIAQLAKANKESLPPKFAESSDTLLSTFQGSVHDDRVDEILNNKFKKGPPEHKITQELLDFLITDWKI